MFGSCLEDPLPPIIIDTLQIVMLQIQSCSRGNKNVEYLYYEKI